MKVFKIRRKTDGLFSSGGGYPSFGKRGKIWTNIGHIKNHLQVVGKCIERYKDCELVCYELTEKEVSTELIDKCMDSHYLGVSCQW